MRHNSSAGPPSHPTHFGLSHIQSRACSCRCTELTADWNAPAQPPSPSFLRVLHAGRVLQDDSTLSCKWQQVMPSRESRSRQPTTCLSPFRRPSRLSFISLSDHFPSAMRMVGFHVLGSVIETVLMVRSQKGQHLPYDFADAAVQRGERGRGLPVYDHVDISHFVSFPTGI